MILEPVQPPLEFSDSSTNCRYASKCFDLSMWSFECNDAVEHTRERTRTKLRVPAQQNSNYVVCFHEQVILFQGERKIYGRNGIWVICWWQLQMRGPRAQEMPSVSGRKEDLWEEWDMGNLRLMTAANERTKGSGDKLTGEWGNDVRQRASNLQ